MNGPAPLEPTASARGSNVVGVSLEDYFHVGAFRSLVEQRQWRRFESRLAASTGAALDLLDEVGATATFFTLGWVAEHMPELVREVAARGHEIANAGFSHQGVATLDRSALAEELARGHDVIAQATGLAPLGTRIPDFVRPRDRWALEVIAEAGYAYDASFRPLGTDHVPAPLARVPFSLRHGPHTLRVFPVPTLRVGPLLVPVGGGAWLRQLPGPIVSHGIERWEQTTHDPFALYFQVWELDLEQPRITAASRLARLRHYRHLDRMAARLRGVMQSRHFSSYAAHLGLAPQPVAPRAPVAPVPRSVTVTTARTPVTVVVPCFNEAEALPFLRNTLESVQRELASEYTLSFVFVDDGSTDATWSALEALAADRPNVQIVRHPGNRGIARAILTGISAAKTELVCSIDADCTYDPHQLASILPPLVRGAALVTASPYHPRGVVRHVPAWRLVLSRTLSRMYALGLGTSLHTYTSCFRGYRRSAFVDLQVEHGGFLGIAEMLARTVRAGRAVEEVPATLEVRLLGTSKLKVLRVIWGHLRLLSSMHRWPEASAITPNAGTP